MNQFLSDALRTTESSDRTRLNVERVARASVPALADFCLVYLIEGEQLRCVAAAHATRAGERLLSALNEVYRITRHDPESTVAQVVRLRRSSLRAGIRPEQRPGADDGRLTRVFDIHRQLGVRSALVVPIEGRFGVLGAIALSYAQSGRQYKSADLGHAERIAHEIAQAVDEAQLLSSQRRQAWLGRRARPALTRLRRALDRLQSAGNGRERARFMSQLAREERMLTRMLERYMASCPPLPSPAGRLRARS
jgi:GAF domain-containing protein